MRTAVVALGLLTVAGACALPTARTAAVDPELGPNRTAFAADGISVIVTRNGSQAEVVILSGRTLSREEATTIASKAAREATRCRGATAQSTRLSPSENTVRLRLSECAGGSRT